MIKRLSVIFLTLCLSFFFVACAYNPDDFDTSLENFSPNRSELGTASRLVPLNGRDIEGKYKEFTLIYDYDYVNGKWDYDTHFTNLLTEDLDRYFMYIEFTEDSYPKVKSYIFNWNDVNVKVDYETKSVYNGYTFYKSHFQNNEPEWHGSYYNGAMAGYNDDKRTLVFISMTCIVKLHPELEDALKDFSVFLKTYFGDFYDFNA